MEDKRKITLTIIGVATLLILVLSATFAYFSAQTSNDKKTTNVTASTEKVGSIALSNPTGDLHLNLSVSDMAQDNLNTYWATDDDAKNYDSEEVQREIAVAELSGGSATAKYECTTTISVELSDTMSSLLKSEDGYIQFGGLLTDKIDLTSISADGYQVTFKLDGTNVKRQRVTAAIALENRNNDQSYIAGEKLGITFTNSDLECQVVSKPTLSETIIALSNVEGSGVYKEIVSGEYPLEYNVLPATEESWTSVSYTGESGFGVVDSEYGTWGGTYVCEESAEGECVAYNSETITFVPLKEGYYKFISADLGSNFEIYIDNVLFREYFVDDSLTWEEERAEGGIDLKKLTKENSIKIVVMSNGINSNFQFEFQYSELEEASLETYRYEGETVNNYITFNDETWRIIGVEEGSAIGLETGKYYTKIIRNDFKEKTAYDGAFLLPEKLITPEEEGSIDDILNAETQKMLVEAEWAWSYEQLWYQYSIDNLTPSDIYMHEKTYTVLEEPWIAILSLMSISDYAYGALQSECGKVSITDFGTCKSWLFNNDSEWLLDAFVINSEGKIEESSDLWEEYYYRPVVYLNSDVIITNDGTGEIDNQYEIDL